MEEWRKREEKKNQVHRISNDCHPQLHLPGCRSDAATSTMGPKPAQHKARRIRSGEKQASLNHGFTITAIWPWASHILTWKVRSDAPRAGHEGTVKLTEIPVRCWAEHPTLSKCPGNSS